MKNVMIKMRENKERMNHAEQAVADYVLNNAQESAALSVHELAARSFVSSSAVLRMCRSLGFEGYRDFRRSLIEDLAREDANFTSVREELSRDDSVQDVIRKVTQRNIRSLQDTQNMMEEDTVDKCVDLMVNSRMILLFGIGASYEAAYDLYLKMIRAGKEATLSMDANLQYVYAKNSTPKDCAIVVTYSGRTPEMITCMESLKENGTPIILISRPVPSHSSELADYQLHTIADESLYRSAAMSSRTSMLNIIDILYTVYANRTYDKTMASLKKTQIKKV
ncbi:MAG: MurR/RpiR family transcriptional regulator [Bulleidia sp.]|nr:MurR/RpiR family transcriptional regulator [Bulleidia sp.]